MYIEVSDLTWVLSTSQLQRSNEFPEHLLMLSCLGLDRSRLQKLDKTTAKKMLRTSNRPPHAKDIPLKRFWSTHDTSWTFLVLRMYSLGIAISTVYSHKLAFPSSTARCNCFFSVIKLCKKCQLHYFLSVNCLQFYKTPKSAQVYRQGVHGKSSHSSVQPKSLNTLFINFFNSNKTLIAVMTINLLSFAAQFISYFHTAIF